MNNQHINSLFNTIKGFPSDVDIHKIEQFILSQPASVYNNYPKNGFRFSLKNIIVTIATVLSLGILGIIVLHETSDGRNDDTVFQEVLWYDTAQAEILEKPVIKEEEQIFMHKNPLNLLSTAEAGEERDLSFTEEKQQLYVEEDTTEKNVYPIPEKELFYSIELYGDGKVEVVSGEKLKVSLDSYEECDSLRAYTIADQTVKITSRNKNIKVIVPPEMLKSLKVLGSGSIKVMSDFLGLQHVDVAGSGKVLVNKPIKSGRLSLKLSGSGRIFFEDSVHSSALAIKISGSGGVSLQGVKAEKTTALILGSGSIKASGTTKEISAEVRGAGSISAQQIVSETGTCDIVGSGKIYIHANSVLDASVSGAGAVIYTGNPSSISRHIMGSGTITAK